MRKKAFTVIELLVTITIIALLVCLVLVALRNAKATAQDAKRWEEINQLIRAIEAYGAMYNQWPGVGDSGGVHISSKCDSDLKNDLISGGLLDEIPADPRDNETECDNDNDGAFFYGWDSAHCCGSCLAPGSSTCQMCISINTFESNAFKSQYGTHSVIGGGDANIGTGDDFNYCFDVDTIYDN